METINSRSWADLSKGKAFAIHFALSLLIFITLVWVMAMWWFPGELFFLDGGWQGLKLIALVDLVLGPALTLMLYKPRKPKLLLDMSLIASFQVAALAYGFYATHSQRTVAVVYADRNFTTLSAAAMIEAHQDLIARELTPKSINDIDQATPAMLFTPEPPKSEHGKYIANLFNGYPEPHERLDLFVKRDASKAEFISQHAVSRDTLMESGASEFVDAAMAKGDFPENDIELHRFKTRYAQGFVIFSKSTQEILDYVPIDWSAVYAKMDAEEASADSVATTDVNTDVNTDSATSTKAIVAESVEQ